MSGSYTKSHDNSLVINRFKETLCEDNTILWVSKLCSCVSVRWCFIELV